MPQAKRNPSSPLQLVGLDIAGETIRDETDDDFRADWCQQLLRHPAYRTVPLFTRKMSTPTESSPYNTLMGRTLFTDDTLRAVKFLYKPPGENGLDGELLALISVGGGMCSHSDTLHGGINTVLVDEIGGALANQLIPEPLMAVNLNVNLRKPVRTPGLILGRAWIDRRPEGRKVWVKIRLEQDGVTCIESENLYLKMQPQGKL